MGQSDKMHKYKIDDETVVDSLFLKLVTLENTPRTTYIRNNDSKIARIQFPVGWAFFSKSNIADLVKVLSKKANGIDFSYICPIMQWAYEAKGRMSEGDNNNSVTSLVKVLNDMVIHRALSVLQGDKKQQKTSVNVFFGRDLRPYDNPHYEPSVRVMNKRELSFGQPDPAADPFSMFGEEKKN